MNKSDELEQLVLLKEKMLLAKKLLSAENRYKKTNAACDTLKDGIKSSAYLNPFKIFTDLYCCIALVPMIPLNNYFKNKKIKLERKYNELTIVKNVKVK